MSNRLKTFFHNSWDLIKETFKSFADHKVTKLSGSLAYSTVFSMGPLLIVIISLCGIFLEKEAIEGTIYRVLQGFVGDDTASQLQEIIRNASLGNRSSIALVIGIVTLIFGATAIFAEVQSSLNIIWGLKPKPKRGWLKFLQDRFLSFSVIVGLGFLLLVSLVVTGVVEAVINHFKNSYPDVTVVIFYIVNLVLTLGISALIFGFVFKVLPDARIRVKDIIVGAIITAVLFLLGKFGISLYIANSKVGSTYGAAGSLVVLLIWVYYSSIILYLGASFTKAYAVKFGRPIMPSHYAVTTKEVEIETDEDTVQENVDKDARNLKK